MLPLQSGEGAGETPSVCQPEYCSWGGLRFHGYKPWELRGDGAMMYTDTDPHRSVRKIATDLLSHWPYIFIVSGKSRPAYQRLIILQQRVNCKEGVFKHPFRHPDRSLNKEWGPHNESQHVCECACLGVCVCRYVELSSGRLRNPSITPTSQNPPHGSVYKAACNHLKMSRTQPT